MADLLSHVLAAYVVFTIASWWIDSLARPWITVGMGGAAIPDLVKIELVLDDSLIETVLGVPFDYAPISSLAGVLLIAGILTLLFEHDRLRVYALLVAGGCSALVLDGLRMYADGRADFWLYPLWWRPPTPNLYVTSDPRVLGVVFVASVLVFLVDRNLRKRPSTQR